MKRGPRAIVAFFRVLYRICLRWSVTGREKVPSSGPLIVVANHVNVTDPVLLMLAMPRWVTFMAKKELFSMPIVGAVMRGAEMIPVARSGSFEDKREVMRQAEELLGQGHVLAVFPEGRRDKTGVLIEAKAGAAFLALHSGAPLLPVAMLGTERITGPLSLLKRPKVRVHIGEPFQLTSGGRRLSRSEAARLTGEIMLHIAELMPPEQRGPYAG